MIRWATLLVALLSGAAAVLAAAPATPPPDFQVEVREAPPEPAVTPTPSASATPPDQACYAAASGAGGDPFVCDLAVQVALDGGSPEAAAAALNNRALVLAREGRLEPALADLLAALAQTPNDPLLHGNQANLLLRADRPTEALAAHDRAVALAPNDPRSYFNRAFSYRALGEPNRAAEDVATAEALITRRNPDRQTPAAAVGRGR